ncbi:MAG: pyruvate kinase [Gemmatimonadota bacterium]
MSADFRRSKVVCTIGPASQDPHTFRKLYDAGMDAVRINFSHASHTQAGEIMSLAEELARAGSRPLAVVADLQGPRIRVGDLARELSIRSGEVCCFYPEATAAPSDASVTHCIPTTYAELARDITPGDRILLDDGRLEFGVQGVSGECVLAESWSDGSLSSQKGINLPGVCVHAPSLTDKDRCDLAFVSERGVDFVALSFVRQPEDVVEARSVMSPDSLLIAKIEKGQALKHLDGIMRVSDGVMVARGDLGVELPYEEVPLAQKRIIRKAQEMARPVITATQMLDSMKSQRRPTRAEVSDVANALLDGTDAVMLSAETATGEFPVEAVHTMDRIIRRIEKERRRPAGSMMQRRVWERSEIQHTPSGAIAAAAMQAVARLGSPFLVTFTRSGFTARIVSAQRPPVPILAVSDQWRTYNQLALVWGVHPILFHGEVNYRNMLACAEKEALERGFGESGDRFVVTAGVPFHIAGTTNMMRIEELP